MGKLKLLVLSLVLAASYSALAAGTKGVPSKTVVKKAAAGKADQKTAAVKAPPPVQAVEEKAPEFVPLHDCNLELHPLKSWLKSASPAADETEKYLNLIAQGEAELQQKIDGQGALGSRFYIKGNQIFERMLMDFASGVNAGRIAGYLATYVDPTVNAARDTMNAARAVHRISKAEREANPALYQQTLDVYKKNSERLGELVSYFQMIMQTLESLAMQRGVLDVATIAQNTNGQSAVMVYDLSNARVATTAQNVIKYLDQSGRQKFLPNAPKLKTDAGRDIPYPTLAVVKTIYGNNVYAKLANQRWKMYQQNYASRPWVWVGQVLADIGARVYGNEHIPPGLRNILRTLSGLGNTDSKSTRYMDKLVDLVQITRFADQKGNIVISSSDYLLNLQIDKLEEGEASGVADEMLEMLVQTTLSRRVLDQLVLALAKRANVKLATLPSKMAAAQAKAIAMAAAPSDIEAMTADDAEKDTAAEEDAGDTAAVQSYAMSVSPYSAGRILDRIMGVIARADSMPKIPYAVQRKRRCKGVGSQQQVRLC